MIPCATGEGPVPILSADMNGDGRRDLVVGNDSTKTISVLLGNGAAFNAPKTYTVGTGVGAAHAIVPTNSPNNLLAFKSASAADLQACLAAGTCIEAPYDNIRGQVFFQIDMRVSKVVKFGERARLELIFQAFDLTDRANFGNSFTGNIRSSSFGTPNNFITPSGVIVPRSFSGVQPDWMA